MVPPSRHPEVLRSLASHSADFDAARAWSRLCGTALASPIPGWSEEEWRAHLCEPLPDAGGPAPCGEGFVLCLPHASELALAPAARQFARLAHGERALLLAPAELPGLAGFWSEALGERVIGADDGLGGLRAWLATGAITRLEASGPPARLAFLRELAGAHGVAFEERLVRNRSLVVRAADDPARLAARALQGAFGRVEAFSGQRAGAIGRVVCHEAVFSRFSAALLAGLERSPDVAHPLPLLEPATRAHLDVAWDLGLDEGATPVFVRREPQLYVFTNVDERMQLATLARCAPVLCLLRATSDERAETLATQLDRHEPAEDF